MAGVRAGPAGRAERGREGRAGPGGRSGAGRAEGGGAKMAEPEAQLLRAVGLIGEGRGSRAGPGRGRCRGTGAPPR